MRKEEGWARGQHPLPVKKQTATKTQTREKLKDISVLGEDESSARELMTPGSESQDLEAARQTTIISTSTITTIGAWNVRTMFEKGKTAQVAAEMRNNKLTLLGISESRWTGSGQRRLATGEMLLFSGHEEEDAPHTLGVALMLSTTAQKALIGWEAHGPRILTATFRTKIRRINMDVIQYYAPTNETDEAEKDDFYDRLLRITQSRPQRNILIVMGGINAKIGGDNTGFEEIMGQQGLLNDNGERFANLCATSSLVIGGSLFQHKRIYKATWVSPDHHTENQIDHVCIKKKFRRSLQDVRVKRGADVGSDHHLLVARLKLKLKKNYVGEIGNRKR